MQVKNLQGLLNVWVPANPLKVDGQFGEYTEDKLKIYQNVQGLTVDGVCGPVTWADILITE